MSTLCACGKESDVGRSDGSQWCRECYDNLPESTTHDICEKCNHEYAWHQFQEDPGNGEVWCMYCVDKWEQENKAVWATKHID